MQLAIKPQENEAQARHGTLHSQFAKHPTDVDYSFICKKGFHFKAVALVRLDYVVCTSRT
jgi:hypothetical protein